MLLHKRAYLAAGLYDCVGRFVHRRWQRKQIAYVLPNGQILTMHRKRQVCQFYHTLWYLEKRNGTSG